VSPFAKFVVRAKEGRKEGRKEERKKERKKDRKIERTFVFYYLKNIL
jgi:hypothetical protein